MGSYSVESLHTSISRKLDKLRELVNEMAERQPTLADSVVLEDVKRRSADIENDYHINVIDVIVEYYKAQSPENDERYLTILRGLNTDNKINECIGMCQDLMAFDKSVPDHILSKHIVEIGYIDISVKVDVINYEYCCAKKMNILAETSQLHCTVCDRLLEIKGMVFEDAQFFSQDGKKTKHGKYDPIKNFHNWMARILARVTLKLNKDEITSLGNCVRRDGFGEPGNASKLTLRDLRGYLQELRLTAANNDASYLLALFSGVPPPQLTSTEYDEVTTEYKTIVGIYAEERVGPNTPYCPYFIYKIIEKKWSDDLEKSKILNYIHLKKPNTLMKWDNHWMRIEHRRGNTNPKVTDYTRFK